MFPVEFKHGPKRQKIYDDIQLAAQAMCLEDMLGRTVPPVNDARCRECSLKEICQPEALAERNRLARLVAGLYDVDEAEIS